MHKYTHLFQFPVTSKPFLTKKASLSADFFKILVPFSTSEICVMVSGKSILGYAVPSVHIPEGYDGLGGPARDRCGKGR